MEEVEKGDSDHQDAVENMQGLSPKQRCLTPFPFLATKECWTYQGTLINLFETLCFILVLFWPYNN